MTKKKDTQLAEAGRGKEFAPHTVNPPISRASTFIFDTFAELRTGVENFDSVDFYGRMGTPTTRALEAAMTELEGGFDSRLFPSGIAAVMTALLSVLSKNDHLLVPDSAYEPTSKYALMFLKRFGIDVDFYDPTVGSNISKLFKKNTKAVFVESPGSLTFEVQDLPAIVKAAANIKAFVLVDNTWGTPYLHNPLAHGADMVIHSATKYLVGHADIMMGTVTANKRAFPYLRKTKLHLGHTVSPDDAYTVLRGLRTLGVRLKQHQENGLIVAKWLKAHPLVDKVLHPALKDCIGHKFWKRDFSGSNGLFSIVLKKGSLATIGKCVDHMEHFKLGLSWGGFESLIYPVSLRGLRHIAEPKFSGPLLRIHVGLEDPDDLIQDLRSALDRYSDYLANART